MASERTISLLKAEVAVWDAEPGSRRSMELVYLFSA